MHHTPFYGYYIRDYLSNVFTIDESRSIETKIIQNSGWELFCEDDCASYPKYIYGIFAVDNIDDSKIKLEKYIENGNLKDLIKDCIDDCGFSHEEKENINFLLANYEPTATLTTVYI